MLRARSLLVRNQLLSMNNAIYFIRHGKPDVSFASYSEIPFSILCDLASGKLDPGINTEITESLLAPLLALVKEETQPAVLFVSPRQRAQETGRMIQEKANTAPPVILQALGEASFDLAHCYSPGAEGVNMDALNEAVLRAMMTGEHAEALSAALERVEEVFRIVREQTVPTICVSHDFFLRAVELSIRHKGNVSEIDPQELLQTRVNHPCCGFKTDTDFSTFVPIG